MGLLCTGFATTFDMCSKRSQQPMIVWFVEMSITIPAEHDKFMACRSPGLSISGPDAMVQICGCLFVKRVFWFDSSSHVTTSSDTVVQREYELKYGVHSYSTNSQQPFPPFRLASRQHVHEGLSACLDSRPGFLRKRLICWE